VGQVSPLSYDAWGQVISTTLPLTLTDRLFTGKELSWVLGRPGVREEEAKALQARMETLTEQLAIEWREKVRKLAETQS
jgi:hypothetical protein